MKNRLKICINKERNEMKLLKPEKDKTENTILKYTVQGIQLMKLVMKSLDVETMKTIDPTFDLDQRTLEKIQREIGEINMEVFVGEVKKIINNPQIIPILAPILKK